jgi:hypothetical protein
MMERSEEQQQAVFGTKYKSFVPASSSSSGEASVVPSLETASEAAAAASQDPYPQWIYGALLTPDAPPSQGSYHNNSTCIILIEQACKDDC